MSDTWTIPVQTPAYVMLSSDYSQQEPKLTAFISGDKNMCNAFKEGRDIYASIASLAFQLPYEKCLEFHPETHEYQPDGKARRGEAKVILLGLTYGRSIPAMAEQLYGTRDDMSEDEKLKAAQEVYDSVLNAFPGLRTAMLSAQNSARTKGYTETILGRRRHLPDMQLPEFEFKAMQGYVNPDVDPLDPSTLKDKSEIPQRIIKALQQEFSTYKYFGQIAKRTRELYEDEHIKVINNRPKINDARRQCLNCVSLDTEILTEAGWKHYDEVSIGDTIYGYSLETNSIVKDTITDITISHDTTDVIEFKSPTFEALSTLNHRWLVGESDENPRIKYTSNIYKNRWPDYPIIRVWDNSLESTCEFSDDELKLIGWILTDGSYSKPYYGVEIFQSTNRQKNLNVYHDMIDTLNSIGIQYKNRSTPSGSGEYHTIYLNKCDLTCKVLKLFPDRALTPEFISTLNQHQAEILMWAMIDGDGTSHDGGNISFTCGSKHKADMFQYLAFIAGYATNAYETTPEQHNSNPSSNRCYESVGNSAPIHITKPYYTISVLKVRRAHIYPHHKQVKQIEGVWCPTTTTSTWVARYHDKVFITGNSVVQGSAADMTKLAMLRLQNSEEWRAIGGRLLVPVHDELIAEVPINKWKEGGELLSKLMSEAGEFLPFPISCDVTTTLRWYGLEYPCPYPKPASVETNEPDEVKWIQYHLFESEYKLPVYKDENGEKPKGDAALGVNGIISDEYNQAIDDFRRRHRLETEQEFLDFIEHKVKYGF